MLPDSSSWHPRHQLIESLRTLSILAALIVILMLGIVGVATPYDYNALPAIPILEVIVLGLSLFMFPPRGKAAIVFFAVAFLYLSITFLVSLNNNAHFLDYIQAYKAFIYVLILIPFINRASIDSKRIVWFFYGLIFVFFVKYTYSRILGLDAWVSLRPGVYVENNFELIFLTLAFFLVIEKIRFPFLLFCILLFIIALSGSRSAFLCVAVVYFFSIFKMGRGFFAKWVMLIPFLLLTAFALVSDRMDFSFGRDVNEQEGPTSGEPLANQIDNESNAALPLSEREEESFRDFLEKGASVDRIRFLLFFLDETQDWRWWDYVFGSAPLTPLSPETCSALSYWEDLYSFSGDGQCYSVILHSYIIRVIFDHGVFGLLFLVLFTAWALRKAGFKWYEILCFIGVMMASSLSVSAFNSVFYPLSMMLFFWTSRESHRQSAENEKLHSGWCTDEKA